MRHNPPPKLRRVATIAIVALLLLTSVPAISLAPDLPDLPEVAPAAGVVARVSPKAAVGPSQAQALDGLGLDRAIGVAVGNWSAALADGDAFPLVVAAGPSGDGARTVRLNPAGADAYMSETGWRLTVGPSDAATLTGPDGTGYELVQVPGAVRNGPATVGAILVEGRRAAAFDLYALGVDDATGTSPYATFSPANPSSPVNGSQWAESLIGPAHDSDPHLQVSGECEDGNGHRAEMRITLSDQAPHIVVYPSNLEELENEVLAGARILVNFVLSGGGDLGDGCREDDYLEAHVDLGGGSNTLAVCVYAAGTVGGELLGSQLGSGCPDGPDPDCCPESDPVPSPFVDDTVSFTVVHPTSVWGPAPEADVAEPFTVDGHVRNELAVPVLLDVEASSQTPSVCSVSGFSTSADAQEVRQRGYVLGPNTSRADATSDAVADLVGEEAVSFSAEVTPKQVGTCTVRYDAVVRTAAGDVDVSHHRASTDTESPPSKEVDLGAMEIVSGDCDRITENSQPDQTVQAGEVGVEGILDWASACDDIDDRWAVLNASYKAEGEDSWRELPGAHLGNPGMGTIEEKVTLDEGNYTFRVQSAYFEGGFTISCIYAMSEAGGTSFVIGVVTTVVIALLLGNPITAGILAAAVAALIMAGHAWWTDEECNQKRLDDDTDFVNVKAENQNTEDPAEELCGLLHINGLDEGGLAC